MVDAALPGPSQSESGGLAGGGEGGRSNQSLARFWTKTGVAQGCGSVCVCVCVCVCVVSRGGEVVTAEATGSRFGTPGGKPSCLDVSPPNRLLVPRWGRRECPGLTVPPISPHHGLLLWVLGLHEVSSPWASLVLPMPHRWPE